jgi:CDP-2,3-bis-(O-geranylgeranyl)-sn-glycerol synthase
MIETFIKLQVLLLAVHGAPVLMDYIFGSRGKIPVDFNRCFKDGRPLFGASKTWRGLIGALLVSCVLSGLFQFGLVFGIIFGALGMAGDLFASFVKRRIGLESSARFRGLDQIPESLLPSFYATCSLSLSWIWIVLLPLVFMLCEMLISIPLYYLKIRKRPY